MSHLPKYMINDKIAEKVKNGAVLPIPEALQEEKDFIVMESDDQDRH